MLDPPQPIEHPSKTDQTAQMRSLIRVFDGCTCKLVPFAGKNSVKVSEASSIMRVLAERSLIDTYLYS